MDEFDESVHYLAEDNRGIEKQLVDSCKRNPMNIINHANMKVVEKNFNMFFKYPLQLYLEIAGESVEYITIDKMNYNMILICANLHFANNNFSDNKFLSHDIVIMRFKSISNKSTIKAIKHFINPNDPVLKTLQLGKQFDIQVLPLNTNNRLIHMVKQFYKYI